MTLRFDERAAWCRASDREAPFQVGVFHIPPTWRTTMWPIEASQAWRTEVGAWLEIAHTVDSPPEDTR